MLLPVPSTIRFHVSVPLTLSPEQLSVRISRAMQTIARVKQPNSQPNCKDICSLGLRVQDDLMVYSWNTKYLLQLLNVLLARFSAFAIDAEVLATVEYFYPVQIHGNEVGIRLYKGNEVLQTWLLFHSDPSVHFDGDILKPWEMGT